MSVVQQLGIKSGNSFFLRFRDFVRFRYVEVQGVKMIGFLIKKSFRSGQQGRADCLAPLSARL